MRPTFGHMTDFEVTLRRIYLMFVPLNLVRSTLRHHEFGMARVYVSANEPLAGRSLIVDVHIQPVACSHMVFDHQRVRGGRNGYASSLRHMEEARSDQLACQNWTNRRT
jgi:hypothetical protein